MQKLASLNCCMSRIRGIECGGVCVCVCVCGGGGGGGGGGWRLAALLTLG